MDDSGRLLAVAVLTLGWLLPLAHVALSRQAGSWRPPPGTACPFGPRAGWLVMIVLLGPLGWLLFRRAAARRQAGPRART